MHPDIIISSLKELSERNLALRFLYETKGNLYSGIIDQITVIINEPNSIENTHSFASFLVHLNKESFIPPLINSISKAVPGESLWLADYMYALIELLSELDEYYIVDDGFVHLLGEWLFSTGGGEISWKSGDVLCQIENQASRGYLLHGAVDVSLLHLTRISCLRGIVNHYRDEASELLSQLVDDCNSKVKEAALDAQAFINECN